MNTTTKTPPSLLTHDEPKPSLKRRGGRLHPAPTNDLARMGLASLPQAFAGEPAAGVRQVGPASPDH